VLSLVGAALFFLAGIAWAVWDQRRAPARIRQAVASAEADADHMCREVGGVVYMPTTFEPDENMQQNPMRRPPMRNEEATEDRDETKKPPDNEANEDEDLE
jgi:hypothetical protein